MSGAPHLRLAEVEAQRRAPGRAALLFLTDRCPVGCAHCSVDSRPEGPAVRDHRLLGSIVAALCARPALSLVGVSGGEPFVERRALCAAMTQLGAAGKSVALYTSGVWAAERAPVWIGEVLRRAACVFLSADEHHVARLGEERLLRAARAIAAQGCWLILQVVDAPGAVARAEALLAAALGPAWREHAELSLVPLLPYGRGASLAPPPGGQPAESFGACAALTAPVVRYDGVVAACCNERVLMGQGPARLRARCRDGAEVSAAIDRSAADPVLAALAGAGAGALVAHPRFAALAGRRFRGLCDLCHALQALAPPLGDGDGLLRVLRRLPRSEPHGRPAQQPAAASPHRSGHAEPAGRGEGADGAPGLRRALP